MLNAAIRTARSFTGQVRRNRLLSLSGRDRTRRLKSGSASREPWQQFLERLRVRASLLGRFSIAITQGNATTCRLAPGFLGRRLEVRVAPSPVPTAALREKAARGSWLRGEQTEFAFD